MAHNWICRYCNHAQIVNGSNFSSNSFAFDVTETDRGFIGLKGSAITCANPECKKPTLTVELIEAAYSASNYRCYLPQNPKTLKSFCLLPESQAKPQPDYIPRALVEDYSEACKIRDLSPKASATLARRCLQGMIRDFCGITKGTLYKEIDELRSRTEQGTIPKGVTEDSIDAIDALRKIGNIGAHMEKDINVIVDVDPHEAQALIEIIETLFDEWYVAREKRKMRFAKVMQIAEQKDADKKQGHADA
ncbi:DUF4145 domain-containing protein [Cognatishimia activa]|uniref:DUF4145 domain-containing protein n=1 Tax=Cognatishimia activa TaxID=1715691 RepID=A0A0P1IRS5_9RHOB|nr:DUF4145 domain-containing protein [Cognatishimia activa]CUI61181.1 hypothetical protein TA5113_00928 [Cognatishimia activa]CUK26291.1 hypothetical protein TA5114_02100 [Cognatishimia activa]